MPPNKLKSKKENAFLGGVLLKRKIFMHVYLYNIFSFLLVAVDESTNAAKLLSLSIHKLSKYTRYTYNLLNS